MSDILCMHVDLYPHISYVRKCMIISFCMLTDVFR